MPHINSLSAKFSHQTENLNDKHFWYSKIRIQPIHGMISGDLQLFTFSLMSNQPKLDVWDEEAERVPRPVSPHQIKFIYKTEM